MRFYALVSLLALPLVGACVSSSSDDLKPDPTPTPSSEGEAYFNTNVKAVFESSCAGCHGTEGNKYGAPVFLGTSADKYYENLVSRRDFVSCDVENSMLLLKGADPGHVGVPLASGDVPLVEQWLDLEADERFGGVCTSSPPAPPPDPPADTTSSSTGSEPPPQPAQLTGMGAMEMFGDCMSYTDWVDAGVPLVAQQTATYNQQQVACSQCHQTTNAGLNYMANPNDETAVMEAFQKMRYMYASFNLVRWTVNDTDGSFKDLVPSYRWRDKGQEGGDHPKFTMTAERVGYYEDFMTRTLDKFHAAVESGIPCDPAAGDPPTP